MIILHSGCSGSESRNGEHEEQNVQRCAARGTGMVSRCQRSHRIWCTPAEAIEATTSRCLPQNPHTEPRAKVPGNLISSCAGRFVPCDAVPAFDSLSATDVICSGSVTVKNRGGPFPCFFKSFLASHRLRVAYMGRRPVGSKKGDEKAPSKKLTTALAPRPVRTCLLDCCETAVPDCDCIRGRGCGRNLVSTV